MKSLNKKISYLILAGGKGSRMGYLDKALLKYDDKQNFLEKILSALDENHEILISKNNDFEINDKRIKVIHDIFKDCGPLGGIHSGFVHSLSDYIFVLTCDTPNITRDFLKYVLAHLDSNFDGMIVRDGSGRIHPLCGIYKRTLFSNIEKNLKSDNFKILNIFEDKKLKILDIFQTDLNLEEILYNVNTPSEFEKIREISKKDWCS
ncbi:MAG: molybdenum cofactor guanylyltransferase [Fusobacteriaceae bacterium]